MSENVWPVVVVLPASNSTLSGLGLNITPARSHEFKFVRRNEKSDIWQQRKKRETSAAANSSTINRHQIFVTMIFEGLYAVSILKLDAVFALRPSEWSASPFTEPESKIMNI
jgi:hypothetical protein